MRQVDDDERVEYACTHACGGWTQTDVQSRECSLLSHSLNRMLNGCLDVWVLFVVGIFFVVVTRHPVVNAR